jgi:hypothetical protein
MQRLLLGRSSKWKSSYTKHYDSLLPVGYSVFAEPGKLSWCTVTDTTVLQRIGSITTTGVQIGTVMGTSEKNKVIVETATASLRELATVFDRLSLMDSFSLTKRLWWGQTSKSLTKIANETEQQWKAQL